MVRRTGKLKLDVLSNIVDSNRNSLSGQEKKAKKLHRRQDKINRSRHNYKDENDENVRRIPTVPSYEYVDADDHHHKTGHAAAQPHKNSEDGKAKGKGSRADATPSTTEPPNADQDEDGAPKEGGDTENASAPAKPSRPPTILAYWTTARQLRLVELFALEYLTYCWLTGFVCYLMMFLLIMWDIFATAVGGLLGTDTLPFTNTVLNYARGGDEHH